MHSDNLEADFNKSNRSREVKLSVYLISVNSRLSRSAIHRGRLCDWAHLCNTESGSRHQGKDRLSTQHSLALEPELIFRKDAFFSLGSCSSNAYGVSCSASH
jgi:hypothetical protein